MILIKNAVIVDADSSLHLKKRDILIKNGKIQKIQSKIEEPKAKLIEHQNLHVSIGWLDSSVSFGEPGFEERQTLENGLKAAAAGGFTGIMLNPNNQPNPQDQSGIHYLLQATAGNVVNVFPVGNLSLQQEGEHLAELYDMKKAGAVSFYDYKKSVQNANLLKVGLQYASAFNAVIQSFPQDRNIAGKGMINEDENSIHLGIKSMPGLAEEIQIARDIRLAQYAGGRLHIPTVSTVEGLKLIKSAKDSGSTVTSSVSIHHLTLTSAVLTDFDTRFKLNPPLRDSNEQKALRKYLNTNAVDLVTSDHTPLTIEQKAVEFDHAAAGTVGLESCFGALNHIVSTERAIALLTNAYQVFGISRPKIKEDTLANLTLFDPIHEYEFGEEHIISTSKNSAFLGRPMKGKILGVVNNKKSTFYV
ncbi:dihydroorotase [Nonlabens xiamenensis]|uniref:dihydroorotase n=1 Tax=Nonlabens xiamenensis TaxID=2341043 RepID=UPI000F609907|nr:dihydroorotase [Nonlabens xiamenensis]